MVYNCYTHITQYTRGNIHETSILGPHSTAWYCAPPRTRWSFCEPLANGKRSRRRHSSTCSRAGGHQRAGVQGAPKTYHLRMVVMTSYDPSILRLRMVYWCLLVYARVYRSTVNWHLLCSQGLIVLSCLGVYIYIFIIIYTYIHATHLDGIFGFAGPASVISIFSSIGPCCTATDP